MITRQDCRHISSLSWVHFPANVIFFFSFLLVSFTLSHYNGTRNYLLRDGSGCLILTKWMSRWRKRSIIRLSFLVVFFPRRFDVSFLTICQSNLNAVVSVIFPSPVFAKPSHAPIFSVIVSNRTETRTLSEENLKQNTPHPRPRPHPRIHFPTTCPV